MKYDILHKSGKKSSKKNSSISPKGNWKNGDIDCLLSISISDTIDTILGVVISATLMKAALNSSFVGVLKHILVIIKIIVRAICIFFVPDLLYNSKSYLLLLFQNLFSFSFFSSSLDISVAIVPISYPFSRGMFTLLILIESIRGISP